MILIADSGSSKTLWVLRHEGMDVFIKVTRGLNPNFTPEYLIEKTIQDFLKESGCKKKIKKVFFYGSGCGNIKGKKIISDVLKNLLPEAKIQVDSDIAGAALGLCEGKPGLACILGTGSNACFTDGKKIISTAKSGGYIFGDNGGGVQIGKFILQDYLDNTLPLTLRKKLEKEEKISYDLIIQKVYREPSPNRFIASLAPFAERNKNNFHIRTILEHSFSMFIEKQIIPLKKSRKYSLNFTGSVAFAFEKEIRQTAMEYGFTCGKFLKSPMAGLVRLNG